MKKIKELKNTWKSVAKSEPPIAADFRAAPEPGTNFFNGRSEEAFFSFKLILTTLNSNRNDQYQYLYLNTCTIVVVPFHFGPAPSPASQNGGSGSSSSPVAGKKSFYKFQFSIYRG